MPQVYDRSSTTKDWSSGHEGSFQNAKLRTLRVLQSKDRVGSALDSAYERFMAEAKRAEAP